MDAPQTQPEPDAARGPLRPPESDAAETERRTHRRRRRLLALAVAAALIGGCGLYFTPGRGPELAACVPEGCALVLHASRPLEALRAFRGSPPGAALLDLDAFTETRAQLERLDGGLKARLASTFAGREVLAAFGEIPDEGGPPDLVALRIGLSGNVLWKTGALLAGENVSLPSGRTAERFSGDDEPFLVARAGDVLLASPNEEMLDAALAASRRAPRGRAPDVWGFEMKLLAETAFETAPGNAPDGSLPLNSPVKVMRIALDARADASGLETTCELDGGFPAPSGASGGSLKLLPADTALAWTWLAPDTDARRAQDARILTDLSAGLGWVDPNSLTQFFQNLETRKLLKRLVEPLSGERCLALLPQKLPEGAPRVAAVALLVETRDAGASATALPTLLGALWADKNEGDIRLERTTHCGVDIWRPVGIKGMGDVEPLGPGVRPCFLVAGNYIVLASSDTAARAIVDTSQSSARLADSAEYKAAAVELPAGRFAECVLLPGGREPDLVALYKYVAALDEDSRSLSRPLDAFLDTTDHEAGARVIQALLESLDHAAVGWEVLSGRGVRITVKVKVMK